MTIKETLAALKGKQHLIVSGTVLVHLITGAKYVVITKKGIARVRFEDDTIKECSLTKEMLNREQDSFVEIVEYVEKHGTHVKAPSFASGK